MLAEGKLKKVSQIGLDQVKKYIKRSKKDLETAKNLISSDEGATLTFVYNAMFHAANALIRSQGYRPGNKYQHIGVIEAVSRTIGKEFKSLILKYNKLRIQRNKFEYQADYSSSKTQLLKDIGSAEEFVLVIERYLQENNPQLKLDI